MCMSLLLIQCERERENDMHWENYTEVDGLASSSVTAIGIDPQGNKWFGTGAGVSKLSD